MRCAVVRELDSIEAFIRQKGQLHCAVVQGLDFREVEIDWTRLDFNGAIFLGCHFPKEVPVEFLMSKGAVIFPNFPSIPYNPYRNRLYSREELMEGWSEQEDRSVDKRIYDHFVKRGRSKADILESLAQRLHDHAIDDGVRDLLGGRNEPGGKKKVVGIMGGHSTARDDPYYKKVVKLARDLSRAGYFVASGGGPGTMEAANLGAWLVDVSDEDLEWVLDVLAKAPHFESPGYMLAAREVLERYPNGGTSLAVPTWFYGHEPSNLFSKHIAKYFSNSIREDGLLAVATHGVVFAPGSAGTTQEIFMDATQNHYVTFDEISPMVFLGVDRYTKETMLFPCLEQLAQGRSYAEYLHCTDDVDSALNFISAHPPLEVAK
ncbi:LOG family protein [Rubritalea sp.]|uniref:LOG family protein n=1 Tax=Rubritalea sp. TaxID=2109375 RepID=UPI003EF30F70